MRHAAGSRRARSTAGMWRQPSSRRRRIWPLTTSPKSSTSAASSVGSAPCVFTRRRNSSFSRSMTFVVRNVFHWCFGNWKKLSNSSPPSWRLLTPPGQRGVPLPPPPRGGHAPGPQSTEAALPCLEGLAPGAQLQRHELLLAVGEHCDHAQDRDAHDLPRPADAQSQGIELATEDGEGGELDAAPSR